MFQFKERLSAAVKSAAFSIVTAGIGVISFCFFFAAAFIWLREGYGTINACLAAGAFFLAVALIAAAIWVTMRKRLRRLAALQSVWTNPQVLAAGFEATRLLGARRSAATSLLLAFAVGYLLTRGNSKT